MPLVFATFALIAYLLLASQFLLIPIWLGLVSATASPSTPPHSTDLAVVLFLLRVVVPSCAVAAIVIKLGSVRQRLVSPMPGRALMAVGVTLAAAKYVALSLPGLVDGLARDHVVLQSVRMVAWLSLPLLLAGAYKVLKAPKRPAPAIALDVQDHHAAEPSTR